MGELKLNASQFLLVGGYDIAGNGHTSAGIITNTANGTGTWTPLSTAMPTALGEVEVAQITASKFLVAGGRPSRDASATISAWILTLNVGTAVASWSRHNMTKDRVIYKDNLQKCGNASHFIAAGGITKNGMESAGLPSVTDQVDVFHYVAPPNQNTSSWGQMIVTGTTKKVYLKQGQGYHNVLHVSDTDFRIAGGATAAAEAITDVHSLQVTSTCDAQTSSVNQTSTSAVIKTLSGTGLLPAARARAALIKSSGTLSGPFAYSFVIATGNDTTAPAKFNTSPPTNIYYFKSSTDTWSTGSTSLHVGRVFGRLVQDDAVANSTKVKMGTGVVPGVVGATNTFLYNTPTSTDVIDNTGTVATSAGTMSNSRVGAAVQLLSAGAQPASGIADYTAWGTKYVGGNPVTKAAQVDVEDF